MALSKTEMMILRALANGAKVDNYKHFNKEMHSLHNYGFINCFFDEQGLVIAGTTTVTPKGQQAAKADLTRINY